MSQPNSEPKSASVILNHHYRGRSVGMLCFFILVGSVYYEQSKGLGFWLVLAFNTFLWPHLAYLACKRSQAPIALERRVMYLDSLLSGYYIATMSFCLWPSVGTLGGNAVSNFSAGGPRLASQGILLTVVSALATGALLGFRFIPDSSYLTSAISVFFILAYISLVSYSNHQIVSKLRNAKRELEQKNNEIRGFANTLEQKVAEKTIELRAALERLQRLDRLKDEFLANTSHELRTPINGIIGLSESLLDGACGPVNHSQYHNLSLIVQSGKRLANLINDILDFSKMKHHELSLQLQPVDIRSAVELALAMTAPLAGTKPLTLINDIRPGLPPVCADENRLQQILLNLLGNAIKFTSRGEVRITAAEEPIQGKGSSGQSAPAGFLRISMSDTGIGIPQDKLDSIFQPFEQADGSTSREFGGTGLGLSVSRQLVALHGGVIGVESQQGIGSTFSFTLPVASTAMMVRGAGTEASGAIANLPAASNSLGHHNHIAPGMDCSMEEGRGSDGEWTILVADDEPVNIQVLKNQLGLLHYRTLIAEDGPSALALVESGCPDLVLLDLMMPRMSGYEVCGKIRESHSPSDLPVIMLTARNQISDLVHGLKCGANDYLTKPFNKDELLARVNTHLELLRANRSLIKAKQELQDFANSLEHTVDVRTAELVQQKEYLEFARQQAEDARAQATRALEELRETQVHLIQSEKMAALGKLIANVAHEINTPIGAVKSSGKNIADALTHCLNNLPPLYQKLDADEEKLFLDLLTPTAAPGGPLGTREERAIVRRLISKLEDIGISDARQKAGVLVQLRAQDKIDRVLPLLGHEQADFILDTAHSVAFIISNTANINMAVERVSKIVFALKSFSRFDMAEEFVEADIKEGVETVLTLYHHQIKQDIELVCEYEDIPPLKCLADELKQVWTNLIHNALQAMSNKGTLTVGIRKENGCAVVSVADSGCGVAEDIRERIFEPFFTTKPVGEGSGLGLSIVSKIVKKHGGRIEVESLAGRGSTFRVCLPYERGASVAEQS